MVINRRLIAALAAVVVSTVGLPAWSAPAAPAPTAKEEFEVGNRYFDVQEYEAALPHFKLAYELSDKRASTIFALAQCERALELYDDAIAHFREYLEVQPKPKDAKAVANTVVLLEEKRAKVIADREAAARAAAAPPPPVVTASVSASAAPQIVASAPPPADEEGGWGSTVLWIAAGVAVAAGGAVALGFALGSGDNFDRGTTGVLLER